MRVARTVGKAVMLGVIVHPVLHIALHGDHQIDHGQDLRRPGQLASPVLHDAVKRADAGIADENREGDDAQRKRNVPELEFDLCQRKSQRDHRGQQRDAECRIDEGRKQARHIDCLPGFWNGKRTWNFGHSLLRGRQAITRSLNQTA